MVLASKASGLTYNKYLSLAAQAVRRCLKDDKRIIAEKRGEMNLRFATWKDGRQGKVMNIAEASAAENSHEASP
ncbi:putative mitochondrial atp synthase epsilon chain domain-containing protein [Golovinomyces cichoracearum]|uniref:Putative mitochondrial atp synthase epsilon chain domain-containing protein n=1 Tax=Golovinomyces cichoracearum TaxID=62708 RepID=A0A420I953_9PEZI|nr:putative mitochondrial atp synthase epsilon chain domain-containing protein [Golovinomyces cichoracearum]